MADVKWIKIETDIFSDDKILLIEGLPSADSIITIWFKLLVLAGRQNNDGVFLLNDKVPFTDEMLASIFRRDTAQVRMALNVFEQFGMIEIINNTITIPNWNKHQTLDSYEKKKERDKIYQQERRAKQKQLCQKSSDNRLTVDDKSLCVAVSDIEEDIDINIYSAKQDDIYDFFESVWKLYPRKKGKSAISKSKIKELYKVGYDRLSKAVMTYANEVKGKDEQYILMGSTFFNGRYKDYLDDEPVDDDVSTVDDELKDY